MTTDHFITDTRNFKKATALVAFNWLQWTIIGVLCINMHKCNLENACNTLFLRVKAFQIKQNMFWIDRRLSTHAPKTPYMYIFLKSNKITHTLANAFSNHGKEPWKLSSSWRFLSTHRTDSVLRVATANANDQGMLSLLSGKGYVCYHQDP